MSFLQNRSKNCLKSIITQCQEIPPVKCTVYGYHGVARAFDDNSNPTTGSATRLCSSRTELLLETPGKAKKAALALQYLPLPFSLSYGTQAVYQLFFSGCSFDHL